MKAIDSNLLVYAALADHPASAACEQYLAAEPVWLTSIINLVEMHRVLVIAYGVPEREADSKFADFHDALVVESLMGALVSASLPLRQAHGIDMNDAFLLQTCRERGIAVLATDDSRLAAACKAFQIAVENPITPDLRTQMSQWEDQNLPAKGLPRMLWRAHRWIAGHNVPLADEFHAATQALSRLP